MRETYKVLGYNHLLSDKEVRNMIKTHDLNNDGELDLNEYLSLILKSLGK